jgi:hypothetical protein
MVRFSIRLLHTNESHSSCQWAFHLRKIIPGSRMSNLAMKFAHQREMGWREGEDRGLLAPSLNELLFTDCGMCGDFSVSFLQADLSLLQEWRVHAGTVLRGFRSESTTGPVVAPNRTAR